MNSSLQQYLGHLLFLLFCLFCPVLASASPEAQSGPGKSDTPQAEQQTGGRAYLGSNPDSPLSDTSSLAITPPNDEAQFSVAKTLGSILLVLTLILFIAFFLKRYMPHRFAAGGKRRFIQILENVPLGEKRNLTLIRIHQKDLLLASTSTSITLIKEIDLHAPIQSGNNEPMISGPKRHPAEQTTETSPDHATFRDLLNSQVRESSAISRERLHPVLSKLSQVRKELRTMLGNS